MTASACQPSRSGGRIRRIAADQLAADMVVGGRVAVEAQTNELRDQLLEAAALLQQGCRARCLVGEQLVPHEP